MQNLIIEFRCYVVHLKYNSKVHAVGWDRIDGIMIGKELIATAAELMIMLCYINLGDRLLLLPLVIFVIEN